MKDLDRILPIKRAAEGRLLAIPGVHAVGVGLKHVAGQLTDEPAIMVFVEKKKPLAELRPEEIVPTEIEGIKTDVYEADVPRIRVDTTKYRPLTGGSRITPGGTTAPQLVTHPPSPPTLIPATGLGGNGTLGCIVKTGETPQRILGLTCQHVVAVALNGKSNTLNVSATVPQITFSGSNSPGSLVFLQLGISGNATMQQVFYTTSASDTLNSIATNVAARITAMAVAGLSAAATGAQINITGSVLSINALTFSAHGDNTWADIHASIAGNVISLTGKASDASGAYVNLNLGAGNPSYGVYVPIADGDKAGTVATNIAKAVTARNLTGVTAIEMDPVNPGDPATVSFTGVQEIECDLSSDNRVGQPTNSFCSKCSKCCNDGIGTVIDARLDLDAALIQLNPDWVEQYLAEIEDIGVVKGIHDITLESVGYPLKTRGAQTAQVQHSTLLSLHVSGFTVFPDSLHTPPAWKIFHRFYTDAFWVNGGTFSTEGDSGSAVLTDKAPNSDSEVVGILFAGSSAHTSVTPIQQIISAFPALNLTIATDTKVNDPQPVPKPAAAPAHAQAAAASASVGPTTQRIAQVQQEISATPAGRKYSELVQRHFPEVQTLVNQNRRVATAWHRNGGPLIARHVLHMPDSPEAALPPEINGKPLSDCLAGIQRVISRYGSPALAADLSQYGPQLSQLAALSYRQTLDTLRASDME